MTQAFLFFHFNLLCQKLAYFCFANTTAVFLPFLYCFLPLCLLPFAIWAFYSLPFGSLLVFLFYVVSFAVFWGSLRFFAISVCFNSRFLTFFILFFAPLPLSFAFETFCALPFSILQTAFCPLLPPFVVFFLFCVWNSPFALLLTAICCKNLLLDKKFSKNKKSLEIVIKTFDNT